MQEEDCWFGVVSVFLGGWGVVGVGVFVLGFWGSVGFSGHFFFFSFSGLSYFLGLWGIYFWFCIGCCLEL